MIHKRSNFVLQLAMLLLATAVFFTVLAVHTRQSRAQDDYTTYLPLVTRPLIFTRGDNLLLNSSFEGEGDCQINPPNPDLCWYHPGGAPELQIPIRWEFDYEDQWNGGDCSQPPVCDNPLTAEPDDWWNAWIRPEVRVIPAQLLPPPEHPLFIWDGNNTLKSFKGYGSISFIFSQEVSLEPGKYVLEVSVFPDLVVGYNPDGSKIPAPDPISGEVRLLVGGMDSDWVLPAFLEKNTYYFVFIISQAQMTDVEVHIRGRYAILNNGWFMDDWWLWRQDDLTLPPGLYTTTGQSPLLAADYEPPLVPYTFPVGNPAWRVNE